MTKNQMDPSKEFFFEKRADLSFYTCQLCIFPMSSLLSDLFSFLRSVRMSPYISEDYICSRSVRAGEISYWLVYKMDYSANFPLATLPFSPL